MINIPSTTAVNWSTPPASTAVSPVLAVQPVSATGRERQAGLGAGQDGPGQQRPGDGGRTARAAREEASSVPLLPRAEPAARGDAAEPARDAAARQEAGQRASRERADQEADAAMKDRLQTVLTSIWQASSAVVERALGSEPADTVPAQPAPGGALAVRRPLPPAPPEPAKALPWPVMPEDSQPSSAALPVPPEEVVAYDEKGNTSTAPLEVGGLVDRRV
ncbi:MAG: hypothetical protein EP306_10665 [Burkholderiales bacterium]|nr:MAG: hypothetical protein EP306_10665 [Burkholderiales bacterium]